jgi:hypothetical protein
MPVPPMPESLLLGLTNAACVSHMLPLSGCSSGGMFVVPQDVKVKVNNANNGHALNFLASCVIR